MSSARPKRTYRRRSKTDHVICVNCNAVLRFDHGQKLYRQRYPLTNRLQDRRWDPSLKPGVSILEGLMETIPELAAGDVSHYLTAMCICHECYILLRQVVNHKFKVQTKLLEFQKKITNITNDMRLETNKQAKKTGKVTKCWACEKSFSKSGMRFGMNKCIVDDLTIKEAIASVLPDESISLQECSEKHTMLCESCFKTLSKIITVQCQAETTRMSFMERTNLKGLISKIQECGDDLDMLDDFILEASGIDDSDGSKAGVDDDSQDLVEDFTKDIGEDDKDLDDTLDERLDIDVAEPSGNIIVISAENVLPTEGATSDFHQENIETQSTDVLTDSCAQVGRKRKLSQSDFEADIKAPSEADSEEESFQENFDTLEKQENEIDEDNFENEEKRRKISNIDVLSMLQTASSNSEELQIDESVEDDEVLEGISIEEKEPATLRENVLKKVVYYLQKNSLHKVFKVLKKNCDEFEVEFQKLMRDYVKREISRSADLEKSDWSKLCSLHSGHVTIESFIRVFQQHLPLLSSVLSCSISGQKQLDFYKLEKKYLLRLITLMGIIAYERNPNCNVLQCLNSIQMAEDGCTSQLYNTFYGLGLCLNEKETQELLARPDYFQHQVCWDLLKEAQEKMGSSATRKADPDKANNAENVSDVDETDDDDDDDDSVPEDFAVVCPYWKPPPENTVVNEEKTATAEWVLYTDPEDPAAADVIRLIFAEAGVTYQECIEPYDSIEVIGGKEQDYPVWNPPVVRKGPLTLSQVPVICRHLGEMFGLCSESTEDKLHAEQIFQACHDFLREGRLLNQKLDKEKKIQSEKESMNPLLGRFIQTRVPRFLCFLENALESNNTDKGFFFGKQLTYVDIVVFHTLRVIEQQFPEVLKQEKDIPQLNILKNFSNAPFYIHCFFHMADLRMVS